MQKDFTVVRYGSDTSGRAVYMTRWMIKVWEAMLADPRIATFAHKILIVQGPWMERLGGGASASAGYHDKAGSVDIRTWNLTTSELNAFIAITDDYGFPFWRRDQRHGMDPHAHGLLLSDYQLASGANVQRSQYLRGESGLASGGPDYERRDKPLALEPPDRLLQEDPMADPKIQAQLDRIEKAVKEGNDASKHRDQQDWRRDKEAREKAQAVAKRQIALLGGIADTLGTLATESDVKKVQQGVQGVQKRILDALAADGDVDGPDAPAKD